MKLGGVASGDRMEPSTVATNTQQATYTVPDRTKKASGCGLLLPWLLWICVSEVDMSGMFIVHGFNMCQQVQSMADTPPPLPTPLKEGDEGPPVAIYALCGPATDDRDVSVAIGCGYLHELTTSFEVGVLLMDLKTRWNADVLHMGGCGYSPNTTHMTRDTSLNGSTAWPVASMADM